MRTPQTLEQYCARILTYLPVAPNHISIGDLEAALFSNGPSVGYNKIKAVLRHLSSPAGGNRAIDLSNGSRGSQRKWAQRHEDLSLERLVSVQEAVTLSPIPKRTLYGLIARGILKTARSEKGRTLISLRELSELPYRRRSNVASIQSKCTVLRLSEKETEAIRTWFIDHEHDKRAQRSVTYCITPLGIGQEVRVRCTCGSEEDVTDYGSW